MFISKNYTFVGICLFIVLGLVLYFSGNPIVKKGVPNTSIEALTLNTQSPGAQMPLKNKAAATQIQGSGNVNATSNKLSGDGIKPIKTMSAAEQAIVDAWMRNNNYMRDVSGSSYDTYGTEELKKLALSGDAYALEKLEGIIAKEAGTSGLIDFNVLAAEHGSTPAIFNVSLLLKSSAYDRAETPDEKKSGAIKVLAWENVATLRGDRYPKVFRNFAEIVERQGIKLTSEDYQAVADMSKNIYNSLQQKRTELGLGEFDNTEPEAVKKYFDEAEKEFGLRK